MDIITAVIAVTVIGLIVGVVLAIASIAFSVPKDEKAEKILEILPGANCGACGYSGCSGYANALSKGEAKPGACTVGGEEVSDAISEFLGVSSEKSIKNVAIVMCVGDTNSTEKAIQYQGIKTCRDAKQIYSGGGKCTFGCLGYGDCIKACEFNSIKICNGIANINMKTCYGCGGCKKVCPQKIIKIIPFKTHTEVKCSNCDKGGETRKACTAGCIGCMRCVKACEYGAIKVVNFNATVDYEKCVGCGKCVSECKNGCIIMIEGDK